MQRAVRSVVGALVFASLAACGGGAAAPAVEAPRAAREAGDPTCPVSVAGTSVTVEDTDTGAALVFVTTGDAAELRRRVAQVASSHNDHHAAMGPLPDGTEQASHDHGGHTGHAAPTGHAGHAMPGSHAGHGAGGPAGSMIGVHSKATTIEIEGGVKLQFLAGAPDVARLQGELRMHAQHLGAGTCAMGPS
jgi:hypothetical protein